MQRISFLASFVIYLEKEVLASREEIAETLGGNSHILLKFAVYIGFHCNFPIDIMLWNLK